jgi:hypothetical protein
VRNEAEPNIPQPVEEIAAFGSIAGATGSTEPAIRVRRNFPETWLWHMLEAGYAVQWDITIIHLSLQFLQ